MDTVISDQPLLTADEFLAEAIGLPLEEVEKALVQMRSRRPETTRGTLSVTLAAHRLVMSERQGDEPLWQTMDRLLSELLRLRGDGARRRRGTGPAQDDLLSLLGQTDKNHAGGGGD